MTLASGCSLVDLTQESVVAEINANFGGAATVQTFEGFDGDNEFAVWVYGVVRLVIYIHNKQTNTYNIFLKTPFNLFFFNRVTLVSTSEFTTDLISLFDGSASGICYTNPQSS